MDSVSTISFKKPDVVLFSVQVVLIFMVVFVSLLNITMSWGNLNLWTVLLTSLLGYIMPNPKIKVMNGNISLNEEKNDKNEIE